MRAMVTSGFAMRRTLRVGPQLQHIRRRDEIDISDITVSLVKKKEREIERKKEEERRKVGETGDENGSVAESRNA